MPRASSSISSESPSQPGKPRWALPGSRCTPAGRAPPWRCASGTTSMHPARPGRRAARRPGRRRSACSLTASSTAAAKPAIAGVSIVPLRMSRSWPPPCSSGVTLDLAARRSARRRRTGRRACAPVRVSASTPLAAKSTGTAPTAWTASVCTGMPCSARDRDDLVDRLERADLVVGPHHGDQRDRRRGRARPPRAARRRRAGRRRRPAAARPRRPRASRSQSSGSSTAWCSTAVARIAGAARVGGAPGPVDALDREVVGLGAAGGEHHLAGAAAERLRDRLAGLLDDPAGVPAGGVQRARVADVEQVRRHRLDRRGHHRRGGGVVEVDRALGDVHSLPSVRRGRDVPGTAEAGRYLRSAGGYLDASRSSVTPTGDEASRRSHPEARQPRVVRLLGRPDGLDAARPAGPRSAAATRPRGLGRPSAAGTGP